MTLFILDFQLLIPFVEEDASKHEDRSAAQSRPNEEKREIVEVNKVMFPEYTSIVRFTGSDASRCFFNQKQLSKMINIRFYMSTSNSLT